MFPIDIRTLYLSYIVINIVNLILIGSIYIQIKKRFPGTLLILLSFFMSATGNILVFFRSVIPDWISISLANTLVVSSTVLLLIGLEKFVKKRGVQIQNYILIFIFFLVHTYFAFIKPDLNARNINLSMAYLLLSFQIAFLMLKRTPLSMRKITRSVGIVFCAVFIIQFLRIIFISQNHESNSNYFYSQPLESVFLLSWEIIIVLLAYSISLMYNERLIIEVHAQEEKFFKAFHAAPFIILISKLSDGEIFEVNKGIQAISGHQPNDLIGSKSTDLNLWKQEADRHKFITDLRLKGFVIEDEYLFRKKSGELFIGLISAEIININNEQCIISVISDISNRKRAEVKLKESEASLREINSTKDKFFSIIAHDLRSPFNGILGFSEVLSEQVRNHNYEGIDKYAEIINTSSQRAMDLLSNLMEWSRSQTGRMEFNPEYIDVVVLINSVNELLKTTAEQKLINVTLNIPYNLILYADKAMIETVLRNLLSNAIKFTPKKGEIIISAEEKEDEYLIFIKDSGVGIGNNNLEKLFRIDGSFSTLGTANENGTGLGLILCKDFIEKHKGEVWVESEVGVGSKFYFSLPKT